MQPLVAILVVSACLGWSRSAATAQSGAPAGDRTLYAVFRYVGQFLLNQLSGWGGAGGAGGERGSRSASPDSGFTADVRRVRKEYDFVVVGAGSGGSVVANRLSEVANWTVLLLEAGDEENFVTDVPLLVSYVTASGDYNWGYRTERQADACLGMKAQRCNWPRGKAMGGTSVINYMVYTRGFAADYDAWRHLGNEGWAYRDVLPYFLKSEDARFDADAGSGGSERHGRGGYLWVERANWRSPLAPHFMDACRQLGYGVNDDSDANAVRRRRRRRRRRDGDGNGVVGDALTSSGCSYVLANTKRGARCSASKAFLRPVRRRRNLHVSKRSRVLKVVLDGRAERAVGVEYLKEGRRRRVFAAKEVVLSAGTLNTPQLLMLSGIGPADHLQALGIPVVRDLKVGHNLQDHVSMAGLAFLVNESVSIVESRYRRVEYALQYMLEGRGPYTVPGGAEVVVFARTKYADAESGSPDMELVFGPGALTGDTGGSLRRMLNLDDQIYSSVYEPLLGHDAWALVPVLLKPRSRGHVKLRSANPLHAPLFYPNYFHDRRDLLALVEGIKQAIEFSKTESMQRFASTLLSTPIPPCRRLTFGSDPYWTCVARHITTNLHHQVGTCKMGPPSDADAVVDPQLRVRGVRSLRVVDASVMPLIPAAHTNAVVFMIGEKAADLIKSDWAAHL